MLTVSGNTRIKFEVCIFNRSGAIDSEQCVSGFQTTFNIPDFDLTWNWPISHSG